MIFRTVHLKVDATLSKVTAMSREKTLQGAAQEAEKMEEQECG